MLRKASLVLLIIALCLPFAAQAQEEEGEPLVIGVLTDHSGALTIYGVEQTNGFELGLEYATDGTMTVGGRPIEFIIRDNGGDADIAANDARELIEVEGAEILFGTPSSGVTLGLKQVARDNEVVLMMGPAAAAWLTQANDEEEADLLEYSFRACRNSSQDAYTVAQWSLENVGDKWVIFAADYLFGQATAASFQAAFEDLGATFVQDTIFAPLDTTDFTAYAQEIIDSGADGMIYIWAGAGIVTLISQFEELGVFDKVYAMGGFTSNDDVVASFGEEAVGSVGLIVYHWSLPDNEINDWLFEQHKERFDDVPDLFTECGFASAQAIVYGIEKAIEDGADPIDATLPEYLVPALEGLEWEGPKGDYFMRPEDHQALMPMYLVQLDNLDDPDQAFYELLDVVMPEDYELPCIAPECPAPEAESE